MLKKPPSTVGRRGAIRLGVGGVVAAVLVGVLMATPSPGASQGLTASYEKLPEKTVTPSSISVADLVRRFGPVVGRPVPGRRFNPRKESQELQLPPNPIFNPPVPRVRVKFSHTQLLSLDVRSERDSVLRTADHCWLPNSLSIGHWKTRSVEPAWD